MKVNLLYCNKTLSVVCADPVLYMQKTDVDEQTFKRLAQLNNDGSLVIGHLNEIFMDRWAENQKAIVEQQQKHDAIERLVQLAAEEQINLEFKDNALYMVGVPLSLTPTIAQAFLDAIENKNWRRLDALKQFWVLVARNPNARTRKDLDTFIQKGQFQLTSNGWIVGYRSARSVVQKDENLATFVEKAIAKVKEWKKTPNDYNVYINQLGGYKLRNRNLEQKDGYVDSLSNLGEVLPYLKTGKYTDDYTKRMTLIPGEFVRLQDCEIEDDPTVTCGKGLHFVNQNAVGVHYYTKGFGDTYMIVLVNPSQMRAIPIGESSNKARTGEYFFLNTLDRDPETDQPVIPEHYGKDVLVLGEELTKKLQKHTYDQLFELMQEEFAAGKIEAGQLEKLVTEVDQLDVNPEAFLLVMEKIQKVDKLTVPKKYMEVYSLDDPECVKDHPELSTDFWNETDEDDLDEKYFGNGDTDDDDYYDTEDDDFGL